MHALGPEAAEAGHALILGLANPVTGAFIGLTLLVSKLMEHWAKMKEALASDIDLSAIERAVDALGQEGMLKAMTEGEIEAENYFNKLNRLATAQETLAEKTADATDAINKQAEADNKELGAKEKAELATLDLQKAQGKISEEQYQQQKQSVKDKFAGLEANNKEIAQGEIIAAKKKGQATIAEHMPGAREIVTEKQTAEEKAKGELDAHKARQESAAKTVADLDAYEKKYRDVILLSEHAKQNMDRDMAAGRLPSGVDAVNYQPGLKTHKEIDDARKAALDESAQEEVTGVPAAQKAYNAAKLAREDEEKKLTDAITRKKALDREILKLEADKKRDRETSTAVGTARTSERASENTRRLIELANDPRAMAKLDVIARGEVGRLDRRAQADPRRPLTPAEQTEAGALATGDVSAAVKTAQASEAHKTTTADQQKQLMDVASAIAGHAVSFGQAAAMLSAAANNIGLFTKDVGKLANAMGDLATMHSGLSGRVESVEAQIANLKAQHRDGFNQ
jgi:hypothetical protein